MRHPSLVCAIASLWPETPHQICQIHALRDASKTIFEQDRKAKLAVRQKLQPKLRQYRSDLAKRKVSATSAERAQYDVLDRYAGSRSGSFAPRWSGPFSLWRLGNGRGAGCAPKQPGTDRKKRGAASCTSGQRLQRLITILREQEAWKGSLAQIRLMQEWVLQVEHIFDGSWSGTSEEVTSASVGERLDRWLEQLQSYVDTLDPSHQLYQGLEALAQTLVHLRPHLVCCYDVKDFPRTNNDLERCIRAIKTRYRRICGRKNWNTYVLRYGSAVAYYEWWHTQPQGIEQLEVRLQQMTRGPWRAVRSRARAQHREQLDRFRFRHHREAFLAGLEAQWLAAC